MAPKAEFVKTKKEFSFKEFEKNYGNDIQIEDYVTKEHSFILYADSFYITKKGDLYQLYFERYEYESKNLKQLERILWIDFAKTELNQ